MSQWSLPEMIIEESVVNRNMPGRIWCENLTGSSAQKTVKRREATSLDPFYNEQMRETESDQTKMPEERPKNRRNK